MMYHEIHRMSREGFSITRISQEFVINWRTVKNYLAMSEQEYERFIDRHSERKKELQPYEGFVLSKLQKYPDTPAAQMHDWLKEHCPDLGAVAPKTVFNFVAWIRQKHSLPKLSSARVYEMVEETAYGLQAQVDFGFYNMRDGTGKQIKVSFFTMVLSRSRYKYIWFSLGHFTTQLAIEAHEKAFYFFKGIPREIVYDQDRVFISDENKGDIILTADFKSYVREQSFQLRFCRKSDPESKGKVENVVKYTKQNFLYNRPFDDIEILNFAALAWLGRTANALPHALTQKPPAIEWEIEQPFLNSYTPIIIKPHIQLYTIRKDNTISWKSNFYSVPAGTYKDRFSKLNVYCEGEFIILSDLQNKEICRHKISIAKGQKIKNTDHARDKESPINELIEQVCKLLDKPEQGRLFLSKIRKDKPRYIRDHIVLARQCIEQNEKQYINLALDYCCANNIGNATDFKAVIQQYSKQANPSKPFPTALLNPLNRTLNAIALTEPAKSAIADYEVLLSTQQ